MDITIPTVLKALSTAGTALEAITAWWVRSRGDSRALIGELKDNLMYLDMVATDDVPLGNVVEDMSVTEYKRLSHAGFNFNKLKKSKIARYPSLEKTDLEKWRGKETQELIVSIYDKINEIKIRFPHVGKNKNYRYSS